MTAVLLIDRDTLPTSPALRSPAELRQRLAGGCLPDVAVLDVGQVDDLPELTAEVHAALPETPLLVVGPGEDGVMGMACLRAGAIGVVAREQVTDGLLRAVDRLRRGQLVLGTETSREVLRQVRRPGTSPAVSVHLTPTQERILGLIATGATNRAIAQRLGLAEKTVKNYATGIFAALGVRNRAEAAAVWAQRGHVVA